MISLNSKVNLSDIEGSGKDGRILKEDILKHLGEIPGQCTDSLSRQNSICVI